MSRTLKITEVTLMDFSKIFSEGEEFTEILHEIGLPMLFFTNKAIYKCVVGKGVIDDTGEEYDTFNQITKEFNFSTEHPIWNNTYKIVGKRPEKELKVLAYHILGEFSSILHIKEYFEEQWKNIKQQVNCNIEDYELSSALLPQIPLLKENLDGFFVECKNLISHILTIFKLYYLKKTLVAKEIRESECLAKIKKYNFKSNKKDNLINVFEKIVQIGKKIRAIRNSISHPENFRENFFLLYNVHWGNNKILFPPIMEYKSKDGEGVVNVFEYINDTYMSLLEISSSFLNILVQDMNEPVTSEIYK